MSLTATQRRGLECIDNDGGQHVSFAFAKKMAARFLVRIWHGQKNGNKHWRAELTPAGRAALESP